MNEGVVITHVYMYKNWKRGCPHELIVERTNKTPQLCKGKRQSRKNIRVLKMETACCGHVNLFLYELYFLLVSF